jgi:hypothetical protein
MSWGIVAAVGGSIIGGVIASNGAEDAAETQAGATEAGIAEQRRQFDSIKELLSPYVNAGGRGLNMYEGLAGLWGAETQRGNIRMLEDSAEFKSLSKQGENAILQNASATGGLRGGNVQGALADFRSNLLSGLIERQLDRTGGLARMGQNSAAGVGNAGITTGQGVAGLLQQQGAAMAGGQLAGANALANTVGGIGGIIAGRGGFGGGGGVSGVQAGFSQTGVGSSGFGTGLAYGNQDMGAYF